MKIFIKILRLCQQYPIITLTLFSILFVVSITVSIIAINSHINFKHDTKGSIIIFDYPAKK